MTKKTKQKKSLFIEFMQKEIRNHMGVHYLTLKDAFNLGITCKFLFGDFIEEEGQIKVTKICSVRIPKIIFPYVTILLIIFSHIKLQMYI